MGTPPNMRHKPFPLKSGDSVHVYSDATRILLQLRREILTEQDILTPSFKTAVPLTEGEALALAAELLSVVACRRGFQSESSDAKIGSFHLTEKGNE
jgi:hypothetical protein